MNKRTRSILAILAGAAVWAVLWGMGTQAAHRVFPAILDPERPVTHTGALLAYVAYSVVLSILAGYTTAVVAGSHRMKEVWILAVLQLTLGIIAEVSYWEMMPVWYHLLFLALVVPATVLGGELRKRQAITGGG